MIDAQSVKTSTGVPASGQGIDADKKIVDRNYRQHLVQHAATLGIDMEITARKPGTRRFTPIPKRWTVERTYG
nr:hypothetical protein [Streptomyces rubrogriseus]